MKNHWMLLAVCLSAWTTTGCERDNMWTQARATRLGESNFFPDGRAAREPVSGTVPYGSYIDDELLSEGSEGDKPTERFPFAVDAKALDRGKDQYSVFCAPCHGAVGDGVAIVVQRGYLPPRPFADPAVLSKSVGELYQVCKKGVPKPMDRQPDILAGTGYDLEDVVHPVLWRKLDLRERWETLAWIRVLQASQRFPESELTPQERQKLNGAPAPRSESGRP